MTTLIPNQTNLNAGAIFPNLGGGGGGGGAGPNPSVSSLSVANSGNIYMSTLLVFNDPSQLTANAVNIRSGADFDSFFGALGTGIIGNLVEVSCPASVGTQLELAGTNNGACAIGSLNNQTLQPSTLTLVADKVIIKDCDLAVSSINGAVPGTAILPNQVSFSSININPQGYIEMFNNNANESGRIIGYGDINNASSISLGVSFVPNYNSKVNGTDGLWTVENDAFGANQAFGDFGAGRLVVLGNVTSQSKPPPVLDGNGDGNLNINADGTVNISTTAFTVNGAPVGNSTVSSFNDAVISSLTVSSVNGSVYPPPGSSYAPFFSTLNQSPTAIDCDGQTTTSLLQFSTIVNHLYMIQTQMTIQPRIGQPQTGTMEDTVIQEILNEVDLNQTVGSLISSMDAANNDLRIGTTGMWKANQTGQTLDIFTTFSTTVQLGDVYLTDFGAV